MSNKTNMTDITEMVEARRQIEMKPTWLEVAKAVWPPFVVCSAATVALYLAGVPAWLLPLLSYGMGQIGAMVRIRQLEARDKAVRELHGN